MNFLTIEKNINGSYTIKDSITNNKTTYYFYSLAGAIKEHRKSYNLKYKHFTRIFLGGI